ncbi:MAG: molybdopterin-binding protein [Candidatus Bathyarchaeota archaeon]|nr:molybdopterin-binding protein [Candidatus Bathyarchaeota archaeon]
MFRKLLSLEDAEKRIAESISAKPLGAEEVGLQEALGRVLAENAVSPIDVPPFNRSTVDGYAVKAEDTFGAEENKPVTLKLAGRVAVGELSSRSVKKGVALEIVTGAPLPRGADAVVMVENTSEKQGNLMVHRAVVKSENVMAQGSDIHIKEPVLEGGAVLSSKELGVLAALGLTKANVFRRPKVAIVSTGAEIVEPGKPLPSGKIYDINTYTLTAATAECGCEPVGLGVVQDDDIKLLKKTLMKALKAADVVITSGGVSVGPKDVVPKILTELGKPGMLIHGVAVKPGKPFAFAVAGGKPIFSLPGHPTSSLLTFRLLVRPALLKMAGRKVPPPVTVKATNANRLFSARGRRTFITVTLQRDKAGQWRASQVPGGESGAITTLAKAEGYVELKETQQFVEAGSEITVFLFKPLLG